MRGDGVADFEQRRVGQCGDLGLRVPAIGPEQQETVEGGAVLGPAPPVRREAALGELSPRPLRRREAYVLAAMLEIEPCTSTFLIWQECSLRYTRATVMTTIQSLAAYGLVIRPRLGDAMLTEGGRIALALYRAKRRRALALAQESAYKAKPRHP